MPDVAQLISVYVSDLHQEFAPREHSDRGWNDYWWDDQWRSDWHGDKWLKDFVRSERPRFTSLAHLMVRPEDFGGLAYDPVSKRVFSLNHLGFSLLKFLQGGGRAALPPDATSQQLSAASIELMIFLAGHGVTATPEEVQRSLDLQKGA